MKHKLAFALGLIVLGMVAFAPIEAMERKDTGPYYALPAWAQTLPASERFIVLNNMRGEAVLDMETGVVWEQSPSTDTFNWYDAQYHCNSLATGGRLGWRLPTIQELSSLVDPTQSNPALPSGHPFSNVRSSFYWSATAFAGSTSSAWGVDNDGDLDVFIANFNAPSAWCVRGGHGVDRQ